MVSVLDTELVRRVEADLLRLERVRLLVLAPSCPS